MNRRHGSQVYVVESSPREVTRDGRRRLTLRRSYWTMYDPALRDIPLPAFADEFGQLLTRLRVWPAPKTPAGLAWRYFRQFLTRTLPHLPDELLLACAQSLDTYMIQAPKVDYADQVFIYDKNAAYSDYLRRLPDLGRGKFVRVKKYAGPVGLYTFDDSFPRSGFYLAQQEDQRARATGGWVWDGDWSAPSPFAAFVAACMEYNGPFRRLVRRLPVFVVGKTWRHTEHKDGSWEAAPTFYPVIWCNVVGGLQAEMLNMAARFPILHAFIDSLHLPHPLPVEYLGAGVGQWKLTASGAADYAGLNQYRVGQVEKKAGIKREGGI